MAETSMFADHIAHSPNKFEPQRQHQFLVEIELDEPTKRLITLSLMRAFVPTMTNDEISIPYLNEIVYVAGKYTPTDQNVEIVDYIDEDSQQLIYNWKTQVYDPTTGFIGAAASYKKRANILLLSPDGQKVRTWELLGVWPKSVNFGALEMGSTDSVKIEMTLRYDKAKYLGRS